MAINRKWAWVWDRASPRSPGCGEAPPDGRRPCVCSSPADTPEQHGATVLRLPPRFAASAWDGDWRGVAVGGRAGSAAYLLEGLRVWAGKVCDVHMSCN